MRAVFVGNINRVGYRFQNLRVVLCHAVMTIVVRRLGVLFAKYLKPSDSLVEVKKLGRVW